MAMVAHLVGIDQLGYEKELGMTPSVSFLGHLHFAFHHIFSTAGHEEWQVVARNAAEGQWWGLGRGGGGLERNEEGPARRAWWVVTAANNAFCILHDE